MAATPEPIELFARWFAEAAAKEPEPNAMSVATVAAGGAPSARMILLKGVDDRGFVFYTNLDSRKAAELSENPYVALCFHWKSLGRQVRVEGVVEAVSEREADAYFATRPRESQLGAWASDQSRPLASRSVLDERVAAVEKRFARGPIPRPPHWSGYRVLPSRVEFWEAQPFRLHDRLVYLRDGNAWRSERLYP
jgi:pyridoxamine 5'-phosphate oxidase